MSLVSIFATIVSDKPCGPVKASDSLMICALAICDAIEGGGQNFLFGSCFEEFELSMATLLSLSLSRSETPDSSEEIPLTLPVFRKALCVYCFRLPGEPWLGYGFSFFI